MILFIFPTNAFNLIFLDGLIMLISNREGIAIDRQVESDSTSE